MATGAPKPPNPKPPVPGELALIQRIRHRAAALRPSGSRDLQLGIGDDCAILRARPGEDLVVTTDFSLETRHFRRDWHTPESIGHRTLARGLSDLAAMGARPVAAFLSLALPPAVARDTVWVDCFLDGLLALAARAPVPLAGGDTAQSPGNNVLADIILLGAVPRGRALRRDRARAGDRLCVTGALGGAAAQLETLMDLAQSRTSRSATVQVPAGPHFFPEPRLAVGQTLVRRRLATAAIDLSDGLSTDLKHLCKASGVCAEIDATAIPRHTLLSERTDQDALALALHGGEDYELLFTVPPTAKLPRSLNGVPVTEIGHLVERRRGRPPVVLIRAGGKRSPLPPGGWEHLR